MKNIRFLSCDWGTSSFRLKLVESVSLKILARVDADEGISQTYKRWKQSGMDESQRMLFYLSIIQNQLKNIEQNSGISLDEIPLLISGMASSSIGMAELPYKSVPFLTDGSDLNTKFIAASEVFRHPTLLISGVKSQNDVMRGEEIQVLGCMADSPQKELLFIHPGTHCKHMEVKNGKVTAFKTYMTGEFFSLLTRHSILSESIQKSVQLEQGNNRQSFEKGVMDSSKGNLLHQCFRVRTNYLFKKLSPTENYFYLSGLLIGYELSDFPKSHSGPIYLSGEAFLMELYLQAMSLLGIAKKGNPIFTENADLLTLKGQRLLLSLLDK